MNGTPGKRGLAYSVHCLKSPRILYITAERSLRESELFRKKCLLGGKSRPDDVDLVKLSPSIELGSEITTVLICEDNVESVRPLDVPDFPAPSHLFRLRLLNDSNCSS